MSDEIKTFEPEVLKAVMEALRPDEYARAVDVLQRGANLEAGRLVTAAASVQPERLVWHNGVVLGLTMEDESGEPICAIHLDPDAMLKVCGWLLRSALSDLEAERAAFLEERGDTEERREAWEKWLRNEKVLDDVGDALNAVFDLSGDRRKWLGDAAVIARGELHLLHAQHRDELAREAATEHAANVVRLAKAAVADRDQDHFAELEALRPWITSMSALASKEDSE